MSDFDAAFKLMDTNDVMINDKGEVVGVEEALTRSLSVTRTLPTKTAQSPMNLNTALAELHASGRPANGKRQPMTVGATTKALRDKFPALRHRR